MTRAALGRVLRAQCMSLHRHQPYTTSTDSLPLVHIPHCNVHRFGQSNAAPPVFRGVEWTVREGEAWAVVGRSGGEKTLLLEALRGHLRLAPPPPPPLGLFPALTAAEHDPYERVALVSFAHRARGAGGAFYDYSARYGAVREEDRITLRQHLRLDLDMGELEGELLERLDLERLLDLPLVALSNGQTRKARIYQAVLERPEMLLLDEPLTGLDIHTRGLLLGLLHTLHERKKPRVIIGLRVQDGLPEWVTHVASVNGEEVKAGSRVGYQPVLEEGEQEEGVAQKREKEENGAEAPIVELRDVKVGYHGRQVLDGVAWTIRPGARWHLQGANGSGKTTLLALLTGDHPQSYVQRHLRMFGRERKRIPTVELKGRVGHCSPEVGNAWPRRRGVSVFEVVGTGFEGTFVPQGRAKVGARALWAGSASGVLEAGSEEERWRVRRVWEVLQALRPRSWAGHPDGEGVHDSTRAWAEREFVDLSGGEQSVVLLARALVGRQRLVILDECWAGMDPGQVEASRRYLRGGGVDGGQAVVVVSHWEEEVPWKRGEGLRVMRIEGGVGRVVEE